MNTTTNEIAVFKALSEEIRVRIMVLLTKGELCVCDLTAVLKLPQSTISRHMAKLKGAQLVTDRREGKWVHYRMSDVIKEGLPDLTVTLRNLEHKSPYSNDLTTFNNHKLIKSC
ncbi:MAG: ArsR family transcriptional regulator [Calditrichaeota bacterium]|nr:MAG: ArsR family transcriptional regulator [Calditrichota bacterium]